MRQPIRLLVTAALIAAAALLGLPGIAAADGFISASAFNLEANTVVHLRVTADSPVTELRAHLFDQDTGAEVAALDDFTLTSGTTTNGNWQQSLPNRLPIKIYRVTVDATDEGGTTISGFPGGFWDNLVETHFSELTANRTSVDFDHREVTVHGTLFGTFPDTGETRVLGGVEVWVQTAYCCDVLMVDTAADGTFSAVVPVNQATTIIAQYVHHNELPQYAQSITNEVPVSLVQSPTKLTVHLSKKAVNVGDSITLTGRLTWQSSTGVKPLGGVTVAVVSEPFGVGTFVTDADGRYSVTYHPASSATYDLSAPGGDPFRTDASASVSFTVAQVSEFTGFAAVRDDGGQVAVSGHIDFPGGATPFPIPVNIEFSSDAVHWRAVTTANADFDGTGDYGFGATIDQPAAGYWRAHYLGRPDFQAATTAPVLVQHR